MNADGQRAGLQMKDIRACRIGLSRLFPNQAYGRTVNYAAERRAEDRK